MDEDGNAISIGNYPNIKFNHVVINNTYNGLRIFNTEMVKINNVAIYNSEENAVYCEDSDFILDGGYLSNNSNGIIIFSGLDDIKIMNTQIIQSQQYGLTPPS